MVLSGRPWTSKEISALRKVAHLGATTAAELLERSVPSVKRAAQRHRISLRTPGSRRGLVLGQPRDASWADVNDLTAELATLAKVRAAVLAGELDMAQLEELARRQARLAAGAPLCPLCTINPQEVEKSGYCRDCWLKELARAHRDDLPSLHAAQQELWRERQQKVRRRRRERRQQPAAPVPNVIPIQRGLPSWPPARAS